MSGYTSYLVKVLESSYQVPSRIPLRTSSDQVRGPDFIHVLMALLLPRQSRLVHRQLRLLTPMRAIRPNRSMRRKSRAL